MKTLPIVALCSMVISLIPAAAAPLGGGFTYQGRLMESGLVVNGTFDLTFTLYDSGIDGNAIEVGGTNAGVTVSNGLFTTILDFGPVFTGNQYWLEIGVRTNGGGGEFVLLKPRQLLTAVPYALYAPAAGVADSAKNVPAGSITAQQMSTPAAPLQDEVLAYVGTNMVWTNASKAAAAWNLGGNSGTQPGIDFIGTLDSQPLEFRVNNQPALRLGSTASSPNILLGSGSNFIDSSAIGATIGGGGDPNGSNAAYASYTTIAGGKGNLILPGADSASVSGGGGNFVGEGASWATIGGGVSNSIGTWATASTVGGGVLNQIQAQTQSAVIVGGSSNTVQVNGGASFIGAGENNTVTVGAGWSAICSGSQNTVESTHSTICGGQLNTIQAYNSTIAGGHTNTIHGGAQGSFIGCGSFNSIQSNAFSSVVSGGTLNTAAGVFAAVPGGLQNLAGGDFTLAGGRRAKAVHQGAFVWADSADADFPSEVTDEFAVRASGGARFVSGADSGVVLPPGSGSWASLSDREIKEDFATVDTRELLERVSRLPILTWHYKTERASPRHIGPVAQDFYAAFSVGADDRHITAVDADGVALAAIQGLNQKLEETLKVKDAKIAELESRLAALEECVRHVRHVRQSPVVPPRGP